MPRRALPIVGLTLVLAGSTAAYQSAPALERFQGFDQDGDGRPEITSVETLFDVTAEGTSGAAAPLVLLLVEPRLLAPLEDAPSLAPALERWGHDLAREGYAAHALVVRLDAHGEHADGKLLLALRELLRAQRETAPLAGAVLVGHFPDALIVRTCSWRRQDDLVLHKGTPEERRYENAYNVRRAPEDVAHRGDVVLADLDGRWEDVYVQPPTRLESVVAVFEGQIPSHGGLCVDLERGGRTFTDFFHVSDGKLELAESDVGPDGARRPFVTLFDTSGDHECAPSDFGKPNVLAQPDVLVSRLDARGVALSPAAWIEGTDGGGLLDESGQPRTLEFASPEAAAEAEKGAWMPDPAFERRLLVQYFERNHAYRTGEADVAWRPASLACDLPSGYGVMRAASDAWIDEDAAALDAGEQANLAQALHWLRTPAVLRTLRAHSNDWCSVFRRASEVDVLAALGGAPWSWKRDGARLVPALAPSTAAGQLDWWALRSLYGDGSKPLPSSFLVHTGCDGISPPGLMSQPYDAPDYDQRQGGEALLFLGGGLALVGRSKVFYDEPRGFAEALGSGATFGAAWAHYFALEAEGPTWNAVGGDIGRKRAYFWAVLGDWTLRLRPNAPAR